MASTFSYFITTTLEHNHSPDAADIEVNCLHVLSFLMRMLYCVREIFHNCQLCLSLWMCIESYILTAIFSSVTQSQTRTQLARVWLECESSGINLSVNGV